MPVFDPSALVADWHAFALEACRVRAQDAQKRQASRDALADDPPAALCLLLATSMKLWRREHTRLSDVSDFLEGLPAQFDNLGNQVAAAVPGCEDGVGFRSRRQFAAEWGRYKRQVRHCVYDSPRFGFASHEPNGVLCPTDYTLLVFYNATIGNVVDNPLWNACASGPERPQFICGLQAAVWRYVDRKPTPIQALHDRREAGADNVAARLDSTREAVDQAVQLLIDTHAEQTQRSTVDHAWVRLADVLNETTHTTQEAATLQEQLVRMAADTHHRDWFDFHANRYREGMALFVDTATAQLPVDDASVDDGFGLRWRKLVMEADARVDASRIARAAGTMNETPAVVAERRVYMQREYIRRGSAQSHAFATAVCTRAISSQRLRTPLALSELSLDLRDDADVVCEVLQQMHEVSAGDRDLLGRIQEDVAEASVEIRFCNRLEALMAESLATDQRAILRMGTDLHAEQVAANLPNARGRLREQLHTWETTLKSRHWTLPPGNGLFALLATDQRLVDEAQLDKTLIVPHRAGEPDTTFASLVGAYTTAIRTMLEPARAAVLKTLARHMPSAQAQPKLSKAVYADWVVDDGSWQRYKPRMRVFAALLGKEEAVSVVRLLDAEPLPRFEAVAEALLTVLRHSLVAV